MGIYTICISVQKLSKKFKKILKKVVDKSISLWYYMQAVCESDSEKLKKVLKNY